MVDFERPGLRVRAADSVLDHCVKAIELEDIEVRVAELKRAAEAQRSHRFDSRSVSPAVMWQPVLRSRAGLNAPVLPT
jgi:hypothetical protein